MTKVAFRFLILYLSPVLAMAKGEPTGIGLVANNLMQPVNVFSDFVQTACILIGGCFLFASIIKYFEHKRSPLMVPLSTVIFLLIAGIILILLPFLSVLTEHGVPYSLMK